MDVTKEVVRRVAELAQLETSEGDMDTFRQGMQKILTLAGKMQVVDTSGVEPLANPLDATQALRPDIVSEGNQRTLFHSIAPDTEDGLYLVPRVVE